MNLCCSFCIIKDHYMHFFSLVFYLNSPKIVLNLDMFTFHHLYVFVLTNVYWQLVSLIVGQLHHVTLNGNQMVSENVKVSINENL